MITDQQRTAIEELAKRFDWSSEEVDKTVAMLETCNKNDTITRGITANARAYDWSPTEENAIRELIVGKSDPDMRVTSWTQKTGTPAASHATEQTVRSEASADQGHNR